MTSAVTILVATMSGTAEMVAEEVAAVLEEHGISARIAMMEDLSVTDLIDGDYLICSSTYGTGDVPDKGKPLYDALRTSRPDLHGVRYGVIGLGDSIYSNTFCFGAKHFDEIFGALGATRVGERLQHDHRSNVYPEEAAVEWAKTWLQALTFDTTSPTYGQA
ncbi:flavodoxin family protein [Burkholderia pseudomallei]|uniref:flavodoxin domain-containing protein n=1 Tax=Burkholderia pseudomallei TaxID=28450 RepID=UPI00052A82CE|nr:flavodoxin domain-containing protein [Burkholderia pseudomallei]AIV74599.1 flavodoxin family protein [Burkholderia pseudomallei]